MFVRLVWDAVLSRIFSFSIFYDCRAAERRTANIIMIMIVILVILVISRATVRGVQTG